MKKLLIALACFALIIGPLAVRSGVIAQDITFDFLLIFDNVDDQGRIRDEVQTPAPNMLIATIRSGRVSLRTEVAANGVISEINVDRNPANPGATARLTVTVLPGGTGFEVQGVVTFDDAQKSTIQFETVVPGVLEPLRIVGQTFSRRGAYVARVTAGTGQFADMVGLVTGSFALKSIGPPKPQTLVWSEHMLFRLAPAGF